MGKRTREAELEAKLAEVQRQNEELQKRLAAQQSGSGAIAQGGGMAAGERGVAAKEIQGDVFIGDNHSITHIVQQARHESEVIDEGKWRRQIADYLIWVRERFGTIELRGVHRDGRQVVQLDLETVYVPLAAATNGRDIQLNEVLAQGQRLIITGGPGSGKTTVLQHIAWVLASAILQNNLSLAQIRLGYKDLLLEKIRNELSELQTIQKELEILQTSGVEYHSTAKKKEENFKETLAQVARLNQSRYGREFSLQKCIEHIRVRIEHALTNFSSTSLWREAWLQNDLATALNLAQQAEDSITLPIFVSLSSYAQERRKQGTPEKRTLATFITHYLIEKQSGLNLPADFFTRLLDRGHYVILLLDGLDEVPDDQERAAVREAIENLVTGRENMRVVVTCRTAAYRGRIALGRDFREIQVKALDEDHLANLIRQAYSAVYVNDTDLRKVKINELLRGISDLESERQRRLTENVERLVDSPLLVRMLLIVHLSERRLPEHRAELYMRATDTMLWPEHTLDEEAAQHIGRLVGGTYESHRELVQHLAFAMHRRGPLQGREIEEGDIRKVLSEVPEFVPLMDSFLMLTRLRGTLLEERMGVYRFIHLAFQEYLVARYLAEVKRSEGGVEAIACFLEEGPISDVWWREPALLVVGYLTLTAPRAASQLLRRLVGITPNGAATLPPNPIARLVAAQLAVTASEEWLSTDSTLHKELTKGIAALLSNDRLASHSPPRLRADLGDTLAKFGDPRFDVDVWYLPSEPLLGFIKIPDGPFIMGSNPARKDNKTYEQPTHEVTLSMYYIARVRPSLLETVTDGERAVRKGEPHN